jgi:hypothetical protein
VQCLASEDCVIRDNVAACEVRAVDSAVDGTVDGTVDSTVDGTVDSTVDGS